MIIRSLCIYILCLVSCLSCKNDPATQIFANDFQGKTMGTYYSIKLVNNQNTKQAEIDSLLAHFNQELSTYIDSSFISKVNDPLIKSKLVDKEKNKWFIDITKQAIRLHKESQGDFDPTVMPLVQYWGFGTNKFKRNAIQSDIDSLMAFVGMDKINLIDKGNAYVITKADKRISLDYSAIAKGYGVDLIAEYLDSKGHENYLVEIGGETKLKGIKADGSPWLLGINKPAESASLNEIILTVAPQDMAMASSGNYRNYYKIDGKSYSHTINPKTGQAIGSDLLAISVISKHCWYADAVATACMVKGKSTSQKWINTLEDTEACFFFMDENEIQYEMSEGFKKYLFKSPI